MHCGYYGLAWRIHTYFSLYYYNKLALSYHYPSSDDGVPLADHCRALKTFVTSWPKSLRAGPGHGAHKVFAVLKSREKFKRKWLVESEAWKQDGAVGWRSRTRPGSPLITIGLSHDADGLCPILHPRLKTKSASVFVSRPFDCWVHFLPKHQTRLSDTRGTIRSHCCVPSE